MRVLLLPLLFSACHLKLVEIDTEADFKSKVLGASKSCIMLYSSWCEEVCKDFEVVLQNKTLDKADVSFFRMDVDDEEVDEVRKKMYEGEEPPATICFDGGKQKGIVEGANETKLEEMLESL